MSVKHVSGCSAGHRSSCSTRWPPCRRIGQLDKLCKSLAVSIRDPWVPARGLPGVACFVESIMSSSPGFGHRRPKISWKVGRCQKIVTRGFALSLSDLVCGRTIVDLNMPCVHVVLDACAPCSCFGTTFLIRVGRCEASHPGSRRPAQLGPLEVAACDGSMMILASA